MPHFDFINRIHGSGRNDSSLRSSRRNSKFRGIIDILCYTQRSLSHFQQLGDGSLSGGFSGGRTINIVESLRSPYLPPMMQVPDPQGHEYCSADEDIYQEYSVTTAYSADRYIATDMESDVCVPMLCAYNLVAPLIKLLFVL